MVSFARPVPRLWLRFASGIGLVLLASSLMAAGLGTSNGHVHSMVIRLLTPLASFSPPGTRFDTRVIGPELREKGFFLPSGTLVSGKVENSASVRLGILRERAMLKLQFDACHLPDGSPFDCKVVLVDVDNAREQVSENRIQGVLAAGHASSWLGGIWYRPNTFLLPRSAMGLTGAVGTVYTHFVPSPVGAAAMLGSRLLFDRLPDPEIEFPAGTDLLVQMELPAGFISSFQPPAPISPQLSQWVAAQPDEVRHPDTQLAGDMIDLVLVGSRPQVEGAFLAAGWETCDLLTSRSFARMYAAFSSMRADPVAPVAPLRYGGNTSTLSFQKTLNTVAKRHHIRIWPGTFPGTPVWLAAATHDTNIILDQRRMSITHRIDPLIDRERSTVVNDLVAAGCVAGIGTVDRPGAVRTPGSGMPSITDGKAVLLYLQDCSAHNPASRDLEEPRHNRLTLASRWLFLEDREYLFRGNVYYLAYRAATSLLKRKSEPLSPED